jgi:hypothetical protein
MRKGNTRLSIRIAATEPCRGLVAVACPLPPPPPALESAMPVPPGLRVVVAGKSAVVVLRPELPYTSWVAPGARLIVVPLAVTVPPGVNVCPPMMKVVPDTAEYVCDPTVSKGAFVMIGFTEGEMMLVRPLTTRAVALGAKEMVVSATTTTPPGVSVDDPIR